MVQRLLPLSVVAIIAFAFGAAVGHQPSAAISSAEAYVGAWSKGDFAAMHALLSPATRESVSAEEFEAVHREAERVATITSVSVAAKPEKESSSGSAIVIPVRMRLTTKAFGTIEAPLDLTYAEGGLTWASHLVFPGLREGETLVSDIELPERAPIMSRDGVPLAEGPAEARTSPLGGAAVDVTGVIGSPDETAQERLTAAGLPTDIPVGTSGLEKAFNDVLIGKPGGRLLAQPASGGEPRVLATGRPRQARPLKTTIDSSIQLSAVGALGGRSGGIVALDTRNGAIRALAGQAYSAPQPPGSTFKVLTTIAALENRLVKLDDYYEPAQGAYVSGRFIRNAHSEFCGGDFREVFARSCNSAFLPLGTELGADRLVEISERFGFNSAPEIFNAEATAAIDPPESTIPEEMTSEEEVGVSAIGQGRVLATPLQMASVAQTIANGGVRTPTSIVQSRRLGPEGEPERAMSPRLAKRLTDLMVGVVTSGTGVAGAISAGQVAGKTGTAEVGPKPGQDDLEPGEEPEQIVDAWFMAFAPASKPRLAVAVMLIDADADGGTVAAPLAAQVLATGLG